MHPLLALAPQTLSDAAMQFAFSILATVLVLGVVRWRSSNRLELLENNAENVGKAMAEYRTDLLKHQEDDCKQMATIEGKLDAVSEVTTRIDEGMKWVKETTIKEREIVHARIADHDARNVQNHKAIGTAIAKLGERTARLEGRKPATRKPTPRKRKG